jgi:hypothetical protein
VLECNVAHTIDPTVTLPRLLARRDLLPCDLVLRRRINPIGKRVAHLFDSTRKAAELGLALVKGRVAQLPPTTNIRIRPGLILLSYRDESLFGEPAAWPYVDALHRPVYSS